MFICHSHLSYIIIAFGLNPCLVKACPFNGHTSDSTANLYKKMNGSSLSLENSMSYAPCTCTECNKIRFGRIEQLTRHALVQNVTANLYKKYGSVHVEFVHGISIRYFWLPYRISYSLSKRKSYICFFGFRQLSLPNVSTNDTRFWCSFAIRTFHILL